MYYAHARIYKKREGKKRCFTPIDRQIFEQWNLFLFEGFVVVVIIMSPSLRLVHNNNNTHAHTIIKGSEECDCSADNEHLTRCQLMTICERGSILPITSQFLIHPWNLSGDDDECIKRAQPFFIYLFDSWWWWWWYMAIVNSPLASFDVNLFYNADKESLLIGDVTRRLHSLFMRILTCTVVDPHGYFY